MKRALAAVLLLAASRAHAAPITLPANRLIIDLPSDWGVWRADGTSNQDILRSSDGGSIALGWTTGDCTTFFGQQTAVVNAVLQPVTVSYLPTGWEARTFQDGATYLACHATDKITYVAQWWSLPTADYNNESSWEMHVTAALTALDGARRASPAAEPGNLVMLPGGNNAQVPLALRFHSTDADRIENRLERADGELVEASAVSTTCDDVIARLAPGASESTSEIADARKWTNNGRDIYCSESTKVAVAGPSGDAATQLLVDSMIGEASDPALASASKLAGSGWEGALPAGWADKAVSGADEITTPQGTLTVRKAKSCTLGGSVYDPSWIPSGWNATIDEASATVRLCTTVRKGHIEVDAPRAMVEGRPRHAVAAMMGSLAEHSDYREPHKPLLPYPLLLAVQSIGGGANGDRGWGVRGGIEIFLGRALSLRAEIGYDGASKLSTDFGATLGATLGKKDAKLRLYGIFGRDQIGSGDTAKLGGDLYYGGGVGYGYFEEEGTAYFGIEYLARHVPEPPAMGGLDANKFPDHEWRFRLDVMLNKTKSWANGLLVEYRAIPTNVFLAGIYTRF